MADKNIAENLYVKVIAPSFLGNKCGKAEITESFTTRAEAEASDTPGFIYTRNAANKFITKWNKDFEA